MLSQVHVIAVITAAAANMVAGSVWYGVFAKPWMKLTGTKGDMRKDAALGYVIAAICSLVIAYVLAQVIISFTIDTVWGGVGIGALAWVGFVGTTFAASYAFEKRPLALWSINAGYPLASFMIMGAILAGWQ